MTCVIGLEYNNKVYMGCDSAAGDGYSETLFKKIFRKDKFIIGYTTSFRMGQLLQYSLCVPEFDPTVPLLENMVLKFVPAVRECLKDGGYSKIESNREEGGTFLVAYNNKLFTIYDDFQVNRFSGFYSSIGCGYYFANGAMEALFDLQKHIDFEYDPQSAILTALMVASKYSGGVSEPFHIMVSE